MPRAWQRGNTGAHWPDLYEGYTTAQYRAAAARAAKRATHPALPAATQRACTKSLLSGHRWGEKARTKEERNAGLVRKCKACTAVHGNTAAAETLEHIGTHCATTAGPLWRGIFRCWEHATGEALDATSVRHTVLGDRRSAPNANTLHDEVYTVVQASTLRVLVEERERLEHDGGTPAPTRRLHARVRSRVIEAATAWQRALRRQGKEEEFTTAWVQPGFLTLDAGNRPSALPLLGAPATAAPDSGTHVFTDGAGTRQEKGEKKAKPNAGWGVVIAAQTADGVSPDQLLCGNCIDDDRAAPTNNAAELLAVYKALHHLSETPQHTAGTVTIWTDSYYALQSVWGRKGKPRTEKKMKRRSHPKLVDATRELVRRHVRDHGVGSLIFRKVKGHSGDPHNDAADALAALGRDSESGAGPPTERHQIQRHIDAIAAQLRDRWRQPGSGNGTTPAEAPPPRTPQSAPSSTRSSTPQTTSGPSESRC